MDEYPEKLAFKSIENLEDYLNGLTGQIHYLLHNGNNCIEAWATTFIREEEKWFVIILSEKLHGKGIGTQILNRMKEDESTLNGWATDHSSDKKMNGEIYKSPLGFYQKNDFKILQETRLELETISAVKIKWTKSLTILNS